MLSRDLFHYHHKREFSKRIHEELLRFLEGIWRAADEELLPIAWHHVEGEDGRCLKEVGVSRTPTYNEGKAVLR